MKRGALLAALLVAAATLARAEGKAADPRLAEANAELASPEGYDRAIALYREILADDPGADEARMWLARVLAWQGSYDASLAEYDRFLERPSPPAWAPIERAEVLSWAGRTQEAEEAFRELLERDPRNARAARGLARVYRWSGRLANADAAFERALEIQADEEARGELRDLRESLGWDVEVGSRYFADNDDFTQRVDRAETHIDLGYTARLFAGIGNVQIGHDRNDPALADDARAVEGWLGVEKTFPGATVQLQVGGRGWDHAPDRFTGRFSLERATPSGGSLRVAVEHGDFLERSQSLDAVRAGILDTTVRLSSWQPLAGKLAAFGWAESSFLDDSNERVGAGLSLDWKPWSERDATLSLSASYLTYTKSSDLYYDPDVDTAGSLSGQLSQWLFGDLSFQLRGELGVGYAHQDGVGGSGFTWGVSGGPTWRPGGGWSVLLRGHTGRSQRAGSYSTHGGRLSIGRAF